MRKALPEITRTNGSAQIRRATKLLGEGLFRLDQEIRIRGTETGTDATGPYWFLACLRVRRGRVRFLRGAESVEAPGRVVGLFLPAYSLVQVKLIGSHTHSRALISRRPLPVAGPREPIAFKLRSTRFPDSVEQAAALLRQIPHALPVGRAVRPSPLAERVKQIIDRTYAAAKPMAAIAKELQTSAATLSRYFKRDYGMPPVRYRHLLRVMDGTIRLLEGGAIADVSQDVGFEDVSNFYRRFHAIGCAPPARHQAKRSKNAKT